MPVVSVSIHSLVIEGELHHTSALQVKQFHGNQRHAVVGRSTEAKIREDSIYEASVEKGISHFPLRRYDNLRYVCFEILLDTKCTKTVSQDRSEICNNADNESEAPHKIVCHIFHEEYSSFKVKVC